LREHLALWISDERPGWRGAGTSPALLLNRRGGRLSARGAHNILLAIAAEARLDPGFSGHILRHTFGTRLVRDGHDLVLVAELMGHARTETTRGYSLPTAADAQAAINRAAGKERGVVAEFGAGTGRTRSTPSGSLSGSARSGPAGVEDIRLS
jgi:integrase/recombinase XerC